jgi:hypothetical protein
MALYPYSFYDSEMRCEFNKSHLFIKVFSNPSGEIVSKTQFNTQLILFSFINLQLFGRAGAGNSHQNIG